ncbi:GntR family transcriptional regulator [Pseudalkalibacillus hwajinpoensis]|uniref:GntR family transcriptional regulator n=1 Tax=Guptibacillus hwajinpoensis TaxID=208199 RepID=A0A4U1MJV0_9BACL|nr:GntR family transcriptional regulator [Pseudalkalibacillus hwajinpoensis]TKD70845.1 GntR family transcriptional regulator [Pseudalkalibacillus hwajinpoensis]
MTNKKRNEELAYEKVKRAIMLRRLLPGQRVTEEWVSQEINMSRTPIRAAFKRLGNEGLLEVIPNRGAFVYNPSDQELSDVFHLRVVLEGYAAKLALPTVTDEHVHELEQLLDQEKKAYEEKDFEEFMRVNGLIHSYPATLTGNKFLLQEVETLNQWSDGYLILKDEFYTIPIEEVKSIPEHLRILNAFREKDIEEMTRAIEAHLLSTLYDLTGQQSVFQ